MQRIYVASHVLQSGTIAVPALEVTRDSKEVSKLLDRGFTIRVFEFDEPSTPPTNREAAAFDAMVKMGYLWNVDTNKWEPGGASTLPPPGIQGVELAELRGKVAALQGYLLTLKPADVSPVAAAVFARHIDNLVRAVA